MLLRWLLGALPGMLLLLLVAGCSSSSAGSSTGSSSTSTSTSAPAPTTAPAAAAPSISASPSAAGAQTVTVNMTDANQFQPATITIPRGATVNWVNTGSVAHTVTDDSAKAASPSDAVLPSGAQAWDSGTVNGGGTFSHTFDVAGAYTYFCIPHESLGMIGHITVTP